MKNKRLTIMVVEDEPMLLQAIGKKLQLEDINGVLCQSGEQALSQLKNFTHPPDAIWLDYYLNDMDGMTFMTKLQSQIKTLNIPVIVISNSASPDKIKGMITLGAKKYLLKAEHRLDEIIKTIKEFVNN